MNTEKIDELVLEIETLKDENRELQILCLRKISSTMKIYKTIFGRPA